MSVVRNHLAPRWDPDLMWEKAGLGSPFLPTKITFGDIDLATERCGNFLFIEGKLPDEEPSLGQQIMFNAAVADGHTVWIIYGFAPVDPREFRWWPDVLRQPITIERFHDLCRGWLEMAEAFPRRVRP